MVRSTVYRHSNGIAYMVEGGTLLWCPIEDLEFDEWSEVDTFDEACEPTIVAELREVCAALGIPPVA